MALSVGEPIARSFDRMKTVLFEPFDLGKWLILGFCAFLAHLGQGGGGGSFGGGPPVEGGGQAFDSAREWFLENMVIILTVVAVVLVVAFALGILVIWLSSRGKFMFIDGVAQNRAAVVDPWRRFKTLGNSLFWFRLFFGLAGSLGVLICIGLAGLVALPDIQAERFGVGALLAIILAVVLTVTWGLAIGLISLLLHDFVVPIMYSRRMRVLEAIGCFRHSILPGNVGSVALYCLVKIGLSLAAGVIVGVLGCLVCCVGAIPYVSTVLFLPVHVFLLCYPLYFIQQFGEEYQIFPEAERQSPLGPPPGAPR